MEIELEPGRYVLAVSGGVDSTVLLHLLHDLPGVEPVVAHFDHGIRPDSLADRELVQGLAGNYGLPFEFEEGRLGPDSGEAIARQARYAFLERVRRRHGAAAIVTAHHQDDVLETAIINLLRGTRRKGLSSLSDRPGLRRPLLKVPKQDLINFARAQDLRWREDRTNNDDSYLRNYVRHNILPRFDEPSRQAFLGLIERSFGNNRELDEFLNDVLNRQSAGKGLNRRWFSQLPHAVALEVMAAWLRRQGIRGFDSGGLERLVVAAKTGAAGRQFDIIYGAAMQVGRDRLALTYIER